MSHFYRAQECQLQQNRVPPTWRLFKQHLSCISALMASLSSLFVAILLVGNDLKNNRLTSISPDVFVPLNSLSSLHRIRHKAPTACSIFLPSHQSRLQLPHIPRHGLCNTKKTVCCYGYHQIRCSATGWHSILESNKMVSFVQEPSVLSSPKLMMAMCVHVLSWKWLSVSPLLSDISTTTA